MKKVLVVVPAFNESPMIDKVLRKIPKKIGKKIKIQILVIDDGSSDATYEKIKAMNIKVLRHMINCGLGAALATGFEYAKMKEYEYIITFDADGQHLWEDAEKILKALIDKDGDVVIGNRFSNTNGLPLSRLIINRLSNVLIWLLYSIRCNDTQSGLRGFNRYALSKIQLKSQRMEVSSEIFKEINRCKLTLSEVPIHGIYTKYSLMKGQKINNAPNVFYKLLINKFS